MWLEMKASENSERKVPPPCTTHMMIVPVSGPLLLPFRSLQDFNISLFGVLSFQHPDNILTFISHAIASNVFHILFHRLKEISSFNFFLIVKSINFSEIQDFSAFFNSKINTEQCTPFLLFMLQY